MIKIRKMMLPSPVACLVATIAISLLIVPLVGLLFARSACRRVFNREPPTFWLWALLRVTRPLGMLWQLLTAPLRCLPDVYVLGEVRCGTTTTATLLRDRLGMMGPFTPWVHPLANEKESFYLVGHYWGFVPAWAYRMCFPTRLVRWWYRAVLRRPFAVFEGCASYLSAPWAPAFIKALTPRAVLVVCIREPVSQNLSWWRLEQGGMAWGSSMGLGEEWCSAPARAHYPPRSFRGALALSRSAAVQEQWRQAEQLASARSLPASWTSAWSCARRGRPRRCSSPSGLVVDDLLEQMLASPELLPSRRGSIPTLRAQRDPSRKP